MGMISLNAQPRDQFGKGAARKIRQTGFIPAVVYGKDDENLHLKIDRHEFDNTYRYGTTLIDFKLSSSDMELKGIVREIQRDPITHEVLHLDFLHIHFGTPIEIDVNLDFIGIPKGTKEGGVFEEHMRTVLVKCLPSQIPEKIEINVEDLDIADSIHVSDLPIEEGVEILAEPNVVIATVAIPRSLKEDDEEEEEITEPILIGDEPDEDEDEDVEE